MKELKALYIIVNAGFASEVVEIARSLGSTGATIINARGSVAKPKTILGITIDTEKEIVLSWQEARNNRDFEKADELRNKINELGIRL